MKTDVLRGALLISCFLAATEVAAAQPATCSSAPDLIFYNANIITLDPSRSAAEAIAIRSDSSTIRGDAMIS